MNFAEVLVAALLLAGASSGSLQIWAAAVAASRGAELGLEQLVELDGALLAAEQHLQHSHRFRPLGADLFLPEGVGFDVTAFVGELAHPLQGLAPQLLLEGLLGSLVGRNELGELGIGLRHGFNYPRHLYRCSNPTPW